MLHRQFRSFYRPWAVEGQLQASVDIDGPAVAATGYATALWLQTTMALSAGNTVELPWDFRVADGYFAAGQTSFWGCKVG